MKKASFLDSVNQLFESHNISDYLFPLLPFLALIPNFFVIPSLTYPGLATQEVGFALAVVACVAMAFVHSLGGNGNRLVSSEAIKLLLPLLCLTLWQCMTLLWAPDRGEALRQLGFWFGFFAFVATAWWMLRARAAWWIFYSLVLLASVLALSLWLEYRTYGAYEMQGTFFNHGITAELLATLWPLFFCVFLFEKQDRVAVFAGAYATIITTAALMLTLRRGALLGAVVASMVVFGAVLLGKMKVAHRLRMVSVIFTLLFFVLPLVVIKREAILTRLQGVTELKQAAHSESVELGLTSRAVTWLTAWEMGKNNWLKGVGLGGFPARYAEYRRVFSENPRYSTVAAVSETEDYDQIRSPLAHSEFLQTFAELGILGSLLYFIFWAQAIYLCWQFRQSRYGFLAFGALCSVVAFSVSAATNAFAFRLTPSIFVLTSLLAMGWSVRDTVKTEGETESAATLPKGFVIALLAFAVLASLLLLQRNYNVYASQSLQGSKSLQGVLDFTFALDNEAANEASIRRYERALSYDPYNAGAHLGLSVLLFQMKRLPECITHADFAFSHGYNRPFTFLLRAFAHEHNGEVEKAHEILKTGLASYPKSFILRAAYAESLRKRGQREEALNQMAILEKSDERLARSWAVAMRYKDEEGTKIAQETNLIPPGELKPELARVLTQARAYHYYRSVLPTAQILPNK